MDNVAKVINFDPPGQAEDYVHRAGRTGRAGDTGVAVTFMAEEHIPDLRTMTRALKLEDQFAMAAGPAPQSSGQGRRNTTGRARRRRSPAGR